MAADESLDRIYIRDLSVRCIIGIYPEERRNKQDVIINIVLESDLRAACRSDRIEDTVDYKGIKNRIIEKVESSSRFLIERLAEDIAELCLADPKVVRATVSVDKPGALRFARSVAVEITRARHG
ncbi:MAG TPA: dihydroneopterin aldolase [Candidatus Hydrogenedentes bacterium]|nr:dihydroneopterin aldolase [Candidatus Hydrogenedentota bacterium]HOV74661.1 dihydroneopterin aldolase [Candidatus Hydrogenedentota bacterium]HPC15553.1 dihydroneopterin aldolase [Candidatus Hydrogenedentota bacterium]HRT19373.1 dihydroneopterin aldolase [Candidatus Hydrogenedentota bacterium]HRT63893.1 dihydroneopterin aldolase [Candidatus Hydrogenedentota bacterium]